MPYVTEQNLTDVVLDRWKAVPDPRLKKVMQEEGLEEVRFRFDFEGTKVVIQ